VGGNLATTDAGGGDLDGTESVNADNLDGTDYGATAELVAGTVFRFDILLNGGDCAALAGIGETLALKIIVTDGGTTVTELTLDSVTPGASVV
jgi:hypothetical protein